MAALLFGQANCIYQLAKALFNFYKTKHMKKIIGAALLFTLATACNNNSNEARANEEDTIVTSPPAVENVNGNIPDSTNTIDVGSNGGTHNP